MRLAHCCYYRQQTLSGWRAVILNSPQPFLPTGLGLDTFLKSTFTTFWDQEIAQPLDPDTRRRAISAWAWVRISSL
jgi:hypothetical protein